MKSGYVAIIGRTNAGKSTLINSIIGTKVAITSPKPKTTRFPIQAVFEDERGQIIFTDTPGLSESATKDRVDVVVYLIDQTRQRGGEENKVIGTLRKFPKKVPKIVAFNKIDSKKKSYKAQYLFLEDEVDEMIDISAREDLHIKTLIETIFKYLSEGKALVDTKDMITPILNLDSETFISEIIREKIYLFTAQEVPYQTSVTVKEIINRKDGTLYVKATINCTHARYKSMLIGDKGRKIKQIGTVARKELSVASNRKVFIDLTVSVTKQ